MTRIIGVDFDNTIIGYDKVFRDVAAELGFTLPAGSPGKKEVRDAIRKRTDGELDWMRVQSIVYAYRLDDAEVIPGVVPFFQACRLKGIRTCIVSHKTVHAHFDEEKRDLRELARNWLEEKGLIGADGIGPKSEDVFFEPTLADKIQRIIRTGCTDFIDDLEEVYQRPEFPAKVNRVLYSPANDAGVLPGVRVLPDWTKIRNFLLDEAV